MNPLLDASVLLKARANIHNSKYRQLLLAEKNLVLKKLQKLINRYVQKDI